MYTIAPVPPFNVLESLSGHFQSHIACIHRALRASQLFILSASLFYLGEERAGIRSQYCTFKRDFVNLYLLGLIASWDVRQNGKTSNQMAVGNGGPRMH